MSHIYTPQQQNAILHKEMHKMTQCMKEKDDEIAKLKRENEEQRRLVADLLHKLSESERKLDESEKSVEELLRTIGNMNS